MKMTQEWTRLIPGGGSNATVRDDSCRYPKKKKKKKKKKRQENTNNKQWEVKTKRFTTLQGPFHNVVRHS